MDANYRNDLMKLIEMSKYAGMREDLVQAAGGNSSVKVSDDKMIIKASGYQLSEINENEGYALVNHKIITKAFDNMDAFEELTEKRSNEILKESFMLGKRPSIETFLHAISGKYTLHTHPIVVTAITCRKDGMDILKKFFPQALFIPYKKPGIELAKEYFKAYLTNKNNKLVNVAFLENHGLIVSANTIEEVMNITEQIVYKIENYLKRNFSSYHTVTKIWKYFPDKIVWLVNDKNILDVYKRDGLWLYQFSPDCIVFLGKNILKLKNDNIEKQIEKYYNNNGETMVLEYNNNLFIVADSIKKALEIQSVLSFSAQISDINKGYDCKLLSEVQQNDILNWDAEKYRKSIK